MKIFKLKYFVILMALGFLWSCQTEDVVANSHGAVAGIKKHYERDGIPSDSDDQYEFSKSQYYHNNILLTDTIQIANLLSNARLLNIDGARKDICVTDQEATLLNQKLNISTSKTGANTATAALDGDPYLHYFYEVTRSGPDNRNYEFVYFNILGPHTHSSTTPRYYTINYFQRAGSSGDPIYKRDFNSATMANGTAFQNLYLVLSNSNASDNLGVKPHFVTTGGLTDFDMMFTINIHNTTRYTRNVEIEGIGGAMVRISIPAKSRKPLHGSNNSSMGSNPRIFNGINNFTIKYVRSNKA